jgi:crossover junction endodeoxyribonuclease RusA
VTELTIDPPCDLINANGRLHHHAKAKLTRAWREAACAAVGFEPYHYRHAHITVHIRFPTNHRRDVGNYYPTAKACVDGLVDARLLADDSDDHITGPDLRRERPNGPLRVRIHIEETP